MKKAKVKRVVKHNIKRLKKLLGLTSWDITIEYHRTESEDALASCLPVIEYQQALIVIDFEKMNNDGDVIESLTHELVHCITASFRTYRDSTNCLISNIDLLDVMNTVFYQAEEKVVYNFCRILGRLEAISGVSDK